MKVIQLVLTLRCMSCRGKTKCFVCTHDVSCHCKGCRRAIELLFMFHSPSLVCMKKNYLTSSVVLQVIHPENNDDDDDDDDDNDDDDDDNR